MKFETLNRHKQGELLSSDLDAEFWDLSFYKGPKLPGSHPDGKKVEKLFENIIF